MVSPYSSSLWFKFRGFSEPRNFNDVTPMDTSTLVRAFSGKNA